MGLISRAGMDESDEVERLLDRHPMSSRKAVDQIVTASRLMAHGSFSEGSVNRRATISCRAIHPVLKDGTVLKGYQVEAVSAMRSMERNTHTPTRLASGETLYHNIGILAEPPGSGSMLTVIAHLMSSKDRPPSPENTYYAWLEDEKANTERRSLAFGDYCYGMVVPPVEKNAAPDFCGVTVIVCSGVGTNQWARTMGETAPSLRPLLVSRLRDLTKLAHRGLRSLDSREGWVIIVSASLYGAFYDHFGGVRFSRLVIDDAGTVTGKHVPRLRACFTWLVESTVEQYVMPSALAPDQRADPKSYARVCSVLQNAGLEDLSRVLVRHPMATVVGECEIEFPLHIHYECSQTVHGPQRRHGRSWDVYAELRPLEFTPRSEHERTIRLMQIGARPYPDAASVGLTKDAQARVAGWREDTCSVCWGDLAKEACVTPCCSQLLCVECTARILTSATPSCPICRADMMNPGMKMVTDRSVSIPRNLTLDRSEYWNTPIRSTLSAVLNAMAAGSRLVLWSYAHTYHLNIRHLGDFVERHGFSSCKPLNGSKYQIGNTLRQFNQDRDAIDAVQKKAIFLTAAWEGRGCHLPAATDVIFLSEVSTSVYQHVMARVLNVASPRILRRAGVLRVHMLHCRGRTYPELYLAREGLGMGADPERYAAVMEDCKERAAAAFAGRRRHYLWLEDMEDDQQWA